MQRIVVNRSFTLSKTFTSDGTPVTPTGTPTIAITRADGTTVTASSVSGTGTGPYTATVTAANNNLLDTLTATWTATISGQANTYADTVEVAGDTLFSIAQAQAILPSATVTQITDARVYAETELEKAIGFALVPRYSRETITVPYLVCRWQRYLRVKWPFIRTVRSATVNGTVLAAGDLTALAFNQNFVFGYNWPSGGTWQPGTVVIGYEHGLDADNDLTASARQAALALAVDYLGGTPAGSEGSIDPRAESIITVDGTVRLRSSVGQFSAVGVNEWAQANRLIPVA